MRPKTILIYTMGKVGSQSVWRSLEAAGFDRIASVSELTELHAVIGLTNHNAAKEVIAWHQARPHERELIVLTIVRDLLARMISGFFQNLTNPKARQFLGDRAAVEKTPIAALVEALDRHVARDDARLFSWFDEFGVNLSFDPYAAQFPTEFGFASMSLPQARLGIVRTENLQAREPELRRLFGSSRFGLRRRNVSSEKWYGPLYRECLSLYRPSPETLDLYYGSRTMRHFYSEAEISVFRSRWTMSPRALQNV
jgi:hypothetical protein